MTNINELNVQLCDLENRTNRIGDLVKEIDAYSQRYITQINKDLAQRQSESDAQYYKPQPQERIMSAEEIYQQFKSGNGSQLLKTLAPKLEEQWANLMPKDS